MGIINDGQAYLAPRQPEEITIGFIDAPNTTYETTIAIDTAGFKGFAVAFATNRVMVISVDDVQYNFQESPDGAAWTDVDQRRLLPTFKQPGNRFEIIDTGTMPYLQTAGAFSAGRYMRTQLIMRAIATADLIVTIIPILTPRNMPFAPWSASLPPNDGKP